MFSNFSVSDTRMSTVYVLNLILLRCFGIVTLYTYYFTLTLPVSVSYIIHNYHLTYLHVYLYYVYTRSILRIKLIPHIHSLTPNHLHSYNININSIKYNTFKQTAALDDGTSFLSKILYK